jgi:hypothetical protein
MEGGGKQRYGTEACGWALGDARCKRQIAKAARPPGCAAAEGAPAQNQRGAAPIRSTPTLSQLHCTIQRVSQAALLQILWDSSDSDLSFL